MVNILRGKYKVNSYKIRSSIIIDVLDDDGYRSCHVIMAVDDNYFISDRVRNK